MIRDNERFAEAERSLIEKAALVITAGRPAAGDLKQAVREITELMHSEGLPPEKVLVTVKYAAYKAGAGPTHTSVHHQRHQRDEVVMRMVGWCVDAYFGLENTSHAAPHMDQLQARSGSEGRR